MRSLPIFALALASVAAWPATGAPAGPPDGAYACRIWIGSSLATLGTLEIKGRTYRGPAHTPTGPFRPFTVDPAGKIGWRPNFSQLEAVGATITDTVVGGTAAKPIIEINYRTARGNRESMECSRR